MANFVFETSLTVSEKATIKERARSGCSLSENGHLCVEGIEKNDYAKVRVYLGGKSYSVNRSRLAFFVDIDFAPLPPRFQLSHLCHLKNCCHPEHITMEPANINNSRKRCADVRQCQGHEGFKECLFL